MRCSRIVVVIDVWCYYKDVILFAFELHKVLVKVER